ncbi:Uncharacterized protein HZ326_8760 [Fusarium oxysporum f. sp. albedinis]|nr:Uncharacterized protein HZ326_8760 [Fusarium oxysporum f. sp. albedinis]
MAVHDDLSLLCCLVPHLKIHALLSCCRTQLYVQGEAVVWRYISTNKGKAGFLPEVKTCVVSMGNIAFT